MGIFGNNYNQKGSGLTKEEAAQRNYFDMVSRHFMDFMKVNLLFFGCIFVFILASALLAWPYLFNLGEFVDAVMLNKNYMLPILPFVPFMFIGPFVAGLTYVLRNWARQEHVFIVSDFFEHTKKNWKQGLALSVLNTFLTYALPTAALFYLKSGVSELLVLVAFVIVSVILIIMNFYTYTMMVTFKMSLGQILKNSFLLTLAKLPQNLFFFIIIFGIHLALIVYAGPIWIVLMIFVLMALSGFTMNYYSWHVIDKYMMPDEADQPEEAVFEDA